MNDEIERPEDDLRAYFEAEHVKGVSREAPAKAAESVSTNAANSDPAGYLPHEARLALQKLLTKGHLLDRSHPDEYVQIIGNQEALKKVLADLGLALRLVPEYKMVAIESLAHTEDQDIGEDGADGDDDDEDSGNSLVRVTRLRLLHSLVLIALRGYYREREFEDLKVIIDLDVLKERMRPFWPLLDAESRSDRKVSGAIKVLERHGILLKVRGSKDRREISPVIVLVMGSSEFGLLNAEYLRLAEGREQEHHYE